MVQLKVHIISVYSRPLAHSKGRVTSLIVGVYTSQLRQHVEQ
jgi:hypothetical protein